MTLSRFGVLIAFLLIILIINLWWVYNHIISILKSHIQGTNEKTTYKNSQTSILNSKIYESWLAQTTLLFQNWYELGLLANCSTSIPKSPIVFTQCNFVCLFVCFANIIERVEFRDKEFCTMKLFKDPNLLDLLPQSSLLDALHSASKWWKEESLWPVV